MSPNSYELGQWRSNIFMLILPSYSVGSQPSIISNTETQRDTEKHNQKKLPGRHHWNFDTFLGCLVMFLMTEVRSWVSLQLFGLSPWDLGLPGSRHSEACPHTENTWSICNNDTSTSEQQHNNSSSGYLYHPSPPPPPPPWCHPSQSEAAWCEDGMNS